tara:strand:- start:53 stop:790 length:738 start_codon:yes stop_codon:yes gene_type:complete
MAFKMKGSSLYGKVNLNRGGNENRPDGRAKSSAFQKELPTVNVSGDKTERHANKFDRVKKEATKGNDETRTAKFAAEYGGTWTKQGNVYRNQDGQSVKEAAIAQGQKKSQEKRDYVAKNTTKKPGAPFLGAVMGAVGKVKGVVDKVKKVKGTIDKVKDVASKIPGFKKHGDSEAEKPGAPAIWPFKKKVKTSGAVLDRERKKKGRGKKIKTSNNKLRNAFNKTTKKISDKIQEPGKKGNIPGFNS